MMSELRHLAGLPLTTLLLLTILPSGDGQCAGTSLVYTATSSYTTFTSVNYPYSYWNNMECLWLIQADNSSHAVRLEITECSIEYHSECVYDAAEVFDGFNNTAKSLGKFCGTSTPSYVSTDQYIFVMFTSDYSLASKGFKAQFKSGPRDSLLDKTTTETELNVVAIVGGCIGGVVLLLIIAGLVFTYVQSAKAKRTNRTSSLLRDGARRDSRGRVHPMDEQDYYHYWGPAPPAYGDLFSSPTSPPPAYCEVDPNPHPNPPGPDSNTGASLTGTGNPVQSQTGPIATRRLTAGVTSFSHQPSVNANTHFAVPLSLRNPGALTRNSGVQNNGSAVAHPRAAPLRPRAGQGGQPTQTLPSNAGSVAAMRLVNAGATNTGAAPGVGTAQVAHPNAVSESPDNAVPVTRQGQTVATGVGNNASQPTAAGERSEPSN